jgi:hypothetical protein
MGITVNYYLDGTTFQNATKVYTDANLTTLAPNGWYSFGGKYRQQTGGFLLGEAVCPACDELCATNPQSAGEGSFQFTSNNPGVYYIKINTGTGVGLIRPYIQSLNNDFIGIQILHGGTLYNDWVNDEGYKSPGNSNPIWLGDDTAGGLPAAGTTFTNQPTFTWDGTQFVQGGNVGYTVNSTTNYNTGAALLNWCGNINKNSNTSALQDVDVTIFLPPNIPGGVNFRITITCPQLLPAIPFNATRFANAVDACNAVGTSDSVYFGGADNSVNSDLTQIQTNGFVYTNQFASSGSPIAGYYKINDTTSNGYMQVDGNGVVIALGTCPP